MGAWGADTFENDTACDWSYGLEDAQDLGYVVETSTRVLDCGEDDLDADEACEGRAGKALCPRAPAGGVSVHYVEY